MATLKEQLIDALQEDEKQPAKVKEVIGWLMPKKIGNYDYSQVGTLLDIMGSEIPNMKSSEKLERLYDRCSSRPAQKK